MMLIGTGDPAQEAVGREMMRIPPYDVTVQVWSETPCKALLDEALSERRP